MRATLIALAILFSLPARAEETTIRVLGLYVTNLGLELSDMTQRLYGIQTAWNNSGLPAASVTTVQILNLGEPQPLAWPDMPGGVEESSKKVYVTQVIQAIVALRKQNKADVVVVFRSPSSGDNACAAVQQGWVAENFDPTRDGVADGLDLYFNNSAYIAIVDSTCQETATAHELGHLLGGGHATNNTNPPNMRLSEDARAYIVPHEECLGTQCWFEFDGTALADQSDVGKKRLTTQFQYSRPSLYFGDPGHDNVRTLARTARSVANYYVETTVPSQNLEAPVDIAGLLVGCALGGTTRYDISWHNNPATNVPVDRFEVWYAQPVSNPYQYGWTVFALYDDTYVAGATARARIKACSGANCSAMSSSSFDAYPLNCGGWGGVGDEPF